MPPLTSALRSQQGPETEVSPLSLPTPTPPPINSCPSLITDEYLFTADRGAPPISPAQLPDLAELDMLLNNL